MALRKKDNKKIVKNVKYENLTIHSKKRKFSKIEVDPFALNYEVDSRSIIIRLKEYFFGVWKEFYIIKWYTIKKTFKDFRMVLYMIICLVLFLFIVDIVFIIFRAKGVV